MATIAAAAMLGTASPRAITTPAPATRTKAPAKVSRTPKMVEPPPGTQPRIRRVPMEITNAPATAATKIATSITSVFVGPRQQHECRQSRNGDDRADDEIPIIVPEKDAFVLLENGRAEAVLGIAHRSRRWPL
jgi:hypothetical protein